MKAHTVQLGGLVTIVGGGTPSRIRADYYNGDIPWITVKDFTDDFFIKGSKERITQLGLADSASRLIPAGNVILGTRMSVGKAAINLVDVAINQDLKALLCGSELEPRYLNFFLAAKATALEAQASGATVKGIKIDDIEALEIPLPTLTEQRRITERLEKADRLRRVGRYALELSYTLPHAAFLEMFGDPLLNPMNWPIDSLRKVCTRFSDGPFGSNLKTSHYSRDGVRVIRLQNIGVGEFLDEDRAYISPSHFNALRKHECLPGDVLIGTLGDPNLRACLLPSTVPSALNKADCIQARVDNQKADATYICWLLNMPTAIFLTPGMIHGETRARISMGQLAELPVPVPPLPRQQQFASVVRRFERLRAQQREAERQAQHLFQTLLHHAFVPQI